MRYNAFLGSHLSKAIEQFFKRGDKADVYIKRYFNGTNLGKRDRLWIRDRFFFYLRHRFLVDRIVETLSNNAIITAMLYDNEPDDSLCDIIERLKKEGAYDSLFNISFPSFLSEKIEALYGTKSFKWFNSQGETTLRINLKKTDRESLVSEMNKEGYAVSITEFSPLGIIVEGDSSGLINSNLFKKGFFEFQDESSQLAVLLNSSTSNSFFDCCSGSGGKSLAAASFFPSLKITASDIRTNLFKELHLRTQRAGIKIKSLTPEETSGKSFDTVFVDAPCSGTGVLRRNPGDRWSITSRTISEISEIQKKILQKSIRNVSANGEILYVTCSFLKEENESIIERFLNENKNFGLVSAQERLKENLGSDKNFDDITDGKYFRVKPGNRRDILFGAILRKNN